MTADDPNVDTPEMKVVRVLIANLRHDTCGCGTNSHARLCGHSTEVTMSRPRLLDLFCGAGGAAMGYARAGFEVVGVDIEPQPNYPFEFHEADALEVLRYRAFPHEEWGQFDAIHASPPCQAYSTVSGRGRNPQREYPELIEPVRGLLKAAELPYVIENVIGAPLLDAVRLCGSSFGLDVRRHRLFECSFFVMVPGCNHAWQRPRFRSLDSRQKTAATVVGVHGHTNYAGELALRERAMGIDWMTATELTQAIPPAYTEHIGHFLMAEFEGRRRAAA